MKCVLCSSPWRKFPTIFDAGYLTVIGTCPKWWLRFNREFGGIRTAFSRTISEGWKEAGCKNSSQFSGEESSGNVVVLGNTGRLGCPWCFSGMYYLPPVVSPKNTILLLPFFVNVLAGTSFGNSTCLSNFEETDNVSFENSKVLVCSIYTWWA